MGSFHENVTFTLNAEDWIKANWEISSSRGMKRAKGTWFIDSRKKDTMAKKKYDKN